MPEEANDFTRLNCAKNLLSHDLGTNLFVAMPQENLRAYRKMVTETLRCIEGTLPEYAVVHRNLLDDKYFQSLAPQEQVQFLCMTLLQIETSAPERRFQRKRRIASFRSAVAAAGIALIEARQESMPESASDDVVADVILRYLEYGDVMKYVVTSRKQLHEIHGVRYPKNSKENMVHSVKTQVREVLDITFL